MALLDSLSAQSLRIANQTADWVASYEAAFASAICDKNEGLSEELAFGPVDRILEQIHGQASRFQLVVFLRALQRRDLPRKVRQMLEHRVGHVFMRLDEIPCPDAAVRN